jgi:O-antigen/teichoic acid export membrane protein
MATAKIKRWAVYVLSFGLGRGALFLAPLLLANFLAASEYGILETALAAASVWASTASLGTSSAVPLVLLRNNTQATMRGIVVHQLLVVGVAVCFALVAMAMHWSLVWKLTALMVACLVMQSLASTHLKTLGHGDASVLIDAGLLGLMATAVLAAQYLGAAQSIDFAVVAALLYLLLLVLAYSRVLAKQGRAQRTWLASIKVGLPLMLGGVVSLLATTSGRLGMGLLASPELTAVYAVLVRAGALPIAAHQLVLIAKFRSLFAQPDRAVERAVLQIVLLVAVSVLGFFALSPWLGLVLGPAFVNAFGQHKLAGMLIVAQAVLWSAIALNDLVIARHQVMHKVLRYSVGFLALALGLGWLALDWSGLSLEKFVLIHSCVMLSFYVVQSWIMNFLGLRLVRVWVTTVALYLLLALVGVGISTVY